jgi:DNA repair protein RecO (recombination protein O)
MRLPPFLRAGDETPSPADLADAFALTGFFLERHAFAPRGLPMPPARGHFIAAITRALPDIEGQSPPT